MQIKNLRLKIILAITFGLLIYITLFLISDAKKINWSSIHWIFLLAALLLALGNYFIRFLRFEYYIKKLGASAGIKSDLLIFFSGLAMGVTPLKSGEAIKSYLIKEAIGEPISKTLPIFFAERIGDLIGLAILGVVFAFTVVKNIGLLAGIITALIASVLIFRNRVIFMRILMLFGRIKFLQRFASRFENMYESFANLFTNKMFLFTIAISTFSWSLEGAGLWLVVSALGASIPVSAAIFIFSFGTIAGAVSMIPGGLGVTEGSVYYLLIHVGLLASVAAASTVLIRFATLWFAIIIGLICLWIFERRINVKKD